jgi:hypothetical protein
VGRKCGVVKSGKKKTTREEYKAKALKANKNKNVSW